MLPQAEWKLQARFIREGNPPIESQGAERIPLTLETPSQRIVWVELDPVLVPDLIKSLFLKHYIDVIDTLYDFIMLN